jgi:Glycosyl hydrolase family 92/Ricin-type beta-trefoil lectin domain
VRGIEDQLWADTPGGIPGNDDLGEMSAWYVWSALGLYPETPGTANLAIGSPLFTEAVVAVGGSGRTLTIDAPNAADASPYVHALTINGTSSALAYLPAADLLSGATLGFTLGSSADTSWAAAPADAPPSYGGTPGTGVTEPVGAITGTETGKCVDDSGAGTSNGTAIQIYTCNGADAQDWTVAPDNTLQVLSDCMDVTGGATTAGTDIDLNTCNGTAAQQWERNSTGELVNPASGLCLTDTSGGATVKTQLTLETCADTTGQVWTLPST